MKVDMPSDRTADRQDNQAAPTPQAHRGTQASTPSQFPVGIHAIIARTGRSAMTSGRAGSDVWKLRFERRSEPYIEPLMGWTADDDTLSQVELSFRTADLAIAYARRQGLPYTIVGEATVADLNVAAIEEASGGFDKSETKPLESSDRASRDYAMRTPGTAGPHLIPEDSRHLVNLADRAAERTRQMLYCWALDSYLLQRHANSSAPPHARPANGSYPRLDNVAALPDSGKADAGTCDYRDAA